MGYTLKLDIYYFSLKRIKEIISRMTPEGERIIYKTEDEDCKFIDFVKSLSIQEVNDTNHMQIFLEDFIKGFNASFKSNKENTQAMSITTDQYKGYNSNDYTAWGIFKGGATGIGYDVYKPDNATMPTTKITNDNVTSLYYFYKIWIPIDFNVGILMIQSYTNTGCSSLFKEQLSNYFISKKYKVGWGKCIPKEYIERYFKDGYINQIQVIHRRKDDSKLLNPIFRPFMKATSRTVISRFKIPLRSFMGLNNYKEILKSQIMAIDTDYDEKKDHIVLYYEDSEGKKAHAKLADIENILPTITLDDSLKEDNSQLPKWDDLHEYTKGLLENIKKQIEYTAQLR